MASVNLGSGWSIESQGFVDHWNTLRGTAMVPASEEFLNQASPRFIPRCYIVEITDEGAVVRFQGTHLVELWIRDFTGVEIHDARPPDFRARSVSNMRHVVSRPCGHVMNLSFSTSKGRKMTSELILLPLAVKSGRAPRLVGFSRRDTATEYQEAVARYLETHRTDWLDVGAGVPASPPQPLMQAH